jgi:hypothetical protein
MWATFEKLALQNMVFGCVTALLMYGDPCVTVTEPYISPCAYSSHGESFEDVPSKTIATFTEERACKLGPA